MDSRGQQAWMSNTKTFKNEEDALSNQYSASDSSQSESSLLWSRFVAMIAVSCADMSSSILDDVLSSYSIVF